MDGLISGSGWSLFHEQNCLGSRGFNGLRILFDEKNPLLLRNSCLCGRNVLPPGLKHYDEERSADLSPTAANGCSFVCPLCGLPAKKWKSKTETETGPRVLRIFGGVYSGLL